MPHRPPVYRHPAALTPEAARRLHDRQRGSAAARGYGPRWAQSAKAFLASHRVCVACLAQGRATPATVVDHVQPHRGDPGLFWDQSNWQALCASCHSRKTASADGGFGNPLQLKQRQMVKDTPDRPGLFTDAR